MIPLTTKPRPWQGNADEMSKPYDPSKIRTAPMVFALQMPSIKLLVPAMCDVGPASQTLGGILKMTLKSTFAAASNIAIECRLPVKTVRNHLTTLEEHGWITNQGRQATRTGRARRTCTLTTTEKTRGAMGNYCPLPWWVCGTTWSKQWSARAVWSVVVRRWLEVRVGIVEALSEQTFVETELPDHLDWVGGEDRFGFSLNELESMTGLSRDSIIAAKHVLCRSGFVDWRESGDHHLPDLLIPNWSMRIIEESVSPGRCRLFFEPNLRGSKNGQ